MIWSAELMRTLQELHTARVTTDSDSGGLVARQAFDLCDPGFNRAAALVEGFRVKPLGERGIGRPSIYARAAALAVWRPSPASSVAFVGCSNYPDCPYRRPFSVPAPGADAPCVLGTPNKGVSI
jgi:hypothetical protein